MTRLATPNQLRAFMAACDHRRLDPDKEIAKAEARVGVLFDQFTVTDMDGAIRAINDSTSDEAKRAKWQEAQRIEQEQADLAARRELKATWCDRFGDDYIEAWYPLVLAFQPRDGQGLRDWATIRNLATVEERRDALPKYLARGLALLCDGTASRAPLAPALANQKSKITEQLGAILQR